MVKTYAKRFKLMLKGTFVNSPKKYIPYTESGKIRVFFRKIDALTVYKKLRRSMNNMNRFLHPKQYKKLVKKIVKG